ncbi:MAG: glucose 1-dehydrogenase [Pseudomonadales bacterium]|nr:glucose 1-dehydrogenase [Pseudomonadales bacterium]
MSEPRRLDGKVAIITGAARGQGEAEARLFAAHGASVVLTDILAEQGQAVAADIGEAACFVLHDVASEADWARVVETAINTFGAVDILVNNAAISRPLKLEHTDLATYQQIVGVNQVGVFLGMRAVLEPMKRAGGGAIINVGSVAALQGTSTLFAYTASKWAVRGMTRSAALELARYNIRVNQINPGVIDTPINHANPDRMNQVLVQTTPMRRMGQPSEIAEAALFLASDAASFATGADFTIDGGMSI